MPNGLVCALHPAVSGSNHEHTQSVGASSLVLYRICTLIVKSCLTTTDKITKMGIRMGQAQTHLKIHSQIVQAPITTIVLSTLHRTRTHNLLSDVHLQLTRMYFR